VITLQQIARAAGCSLATVSYALRGDPRIRPETRKRVQAVAEQLGYRPNPRFSALMSHIRQSRPVAAGERIAFVWVHTPRAESAKDPFLQRVFQGAKARAEALGFGLEQFWTAERGMTDRRLSQVMKSRGIVGVLLSPVIHEAEVALDLEWDCFAPAVIGSARWSPELHHAGHHHYLAMRLTLEKLAAAGYHRPLAIIEAGVNERARRAWEAAFTVFHPNREAAAQLLWIGLPGDRRVVARRIKESQPDAFVMSDHATIEQFRALDVEGAAARPIVNLHWLPSAPEFGGVNQSYDLVAANAVDLVVSQLSSNEHGVPMWPRMLLFPGRWMDPQVQVARPVRKTRRREVRRAPVVVEPSVATRH
jgi:LacI family transcriptional regulator